MPTISGTVNLDGKPLGNAYVRLYGPSGEFVAEEYTRDDGAFRFHVVEGEWRLEARAARAETASQTVGVSGSDATVTVDLKPAG